MRKTQFFCDRCGKLIEDTVHILATHYYGPDGSRDEEEGAELCKDCYNVVDKAIADLIKPPKQKKRPEVMANSTWILAKLQHCIMPDGVQSR